MKWIEALKKWNAEHNPGKYCIVKKGTKEYDEVRAIMSGKKIEAKPSSDKELIDEIDELLGDKKKKMPTKAEFAAHKAKTIEEAKKKSVAKKVIAKAILKRVMEKREKKNADWKNRVKVGDRVDHDIYEKERVFNSYSKIEEIGPDFIRLEKSKKKLVWDPPEEGDSDGRFVYEKSSRPGDQKEVATILSKKKQEKLRKERDL